MATNEAKIENLRRWIRAYGEIAGYADRLGSIQEGVEQAYREAFERRADFDVLGSILGRQYKSAEAVARKAAWIAQWHSSCRAVCVGTQILQKQNHRFQCAMLDQIAQLGIKIKPVVFESFTEHMDSTPHVKRVDAVLPDTERRRITVVKGVSTDRMRLRDSTELFSSGAGTCVEVPANVVASLIFAEWILRSAMPDYEVRCIVAGVSPDPGIWTFRAFETSGSILRDVQERTVGLPVSKERWTSVLGAGSMDLLDSVPDLPVRDPFMKLPVDRATRAHMILDAVWKRQAASSQLISMSVSEIAEDVQDRFLINYTPDWRRHDIEDCLIPGGFVERLRYERKRYALTPLGVFEAMMAHRQLATPMRAAKLEEDVPHLLRVVQRQARLLARYADGEQVCME